MKRAGELTIADQIAIERLKQLRVQNAKTAAEAYGIMRGDGVAPGFRQFCRALAMQAACIHGSPSPASATVENYARLIEAFAIEAPAPVARNAAAARPSKRRKGHH